ncbi:MAG: energy transducer TonB [Pseudomonadota bacterium]
MTNKAKALSFSLLLHVGMVSGVMFFARHPVPEPPLLVIDFSMVAHAAESEQTPGPGEWQNAASTPPPRVEPMVEKLNEPEKPLEKPPDIPEKIVSKAKLAREKVKKHLQPMDEKKEEIPQPSVIEEQEPQSSAIATEKTSIDDGDGAPSSHSEAQSQDLKTAETEPHTESGRKKSYDFAFVRNLIVKNLSFPATARRMGLTGKIVIAFFLKEDGQVANITVVESSGHDILDNTVVATIQNISPFPMPPAAARIVLPITFHLR